MKLITSRQVGVVEEPVRAKLAMVVPILRATLYSLAQSRINRLGGLEQISLHDLAREYREGNGDAGICFEYSIHEAIANGNPLIHGLASEVLENLCKIKGGAESLLFGPEKERVIPIFESVERALTDESVVYVGNRGRPPKLKAYVSKIISAYRRNEERNKLPRSISGIWKADLFLGNQETDAWVGTTVKISEKFLQPANGLRIGIYPRGGAKDVPRKDDSLNLIRLPLPYDGEFMEVFYKSFFLVRAFLRSDAKIPKPVDLPDAEDRLISEQLESRRQFAVLDVAEAIEAIAQPDLIESAELREEKESARISEEEGLQQQSLPLPSTTPDPVSVTPEPFAE